MNKKKITALVLAGVMTVGIVGATLAWFTSKDEITNIFSTETDLNSGINIEEHFPGSVPDENGNPVYNKPVVPGVDITKEAWIESKATYNQFVRAKIVKEFKDKNGNTVNQFKVESNGMVSYKNSASLETGYEWLSLDAINVETLGENDWIDGLKDSTDTTASQHTSKWYYYNAVVKPNTVADNHTITDGNITLDTNTCHTKLLIEKVSLDGTKTGNPLFQSAYENLRFDVKIVSESIQSDGVTRDDVAKAWSTDGTIANTDIPASDDWMESLE